MLPLITLEEHYISREAGSSHFAGFPQELITKLESLGEERIKDLDNGGVSIQVISHGPLESSPDVCLKANNELAQAISRNPTRLAGFSVLPMTDPKAAANELSRCVKDIGFVGALVDNHLEEGGFTTSSNFGPSSKRLRIWMSQFTCIQPLLQIPCWAITRATTVKKVQLR